jgi:hypothetical protein
MFVLSVALDEFVIFMLIMPKLQLNLFVLVYFRLQELILLTEFTDPSIQLSNDMPQTAILS